MRWHKHKKKCGPEDGDERIVNRFLFIPKCINNEYRWLEYTRILQRYRGYDVERGVGGYWRDIDFF